MSRASAATSRLWITEKPSAAQNLIAGLARAFGTKVENRATSLKDGYFLLSNGDKVMPLLGHLLEMEFLTEEHRRASRADYFNGLLPIRRPFATVPRLEGEGKVRKPVRQYVVAKKLIADAREIVHAGDIDREGQRIVDELLEHCGVDPQGRQRPVYRLALVSAREEDIAKQVAGLTESNGDPKWVRRGEAGLARQICDAALGFNASMAYQVVTGEPKTSVGRVKSPVLALVVDRERLIRNFRPRDYFVPRVTLVDGTVLSFHHRQGFEGQAGFDEAGRIVDEAIAKEICSRINSGLTGKVLEAQAKAGKEAPPLPFSATVLYSTVAKRTGMTPKQAEKAAQSLYERHKAISYVGTDCRYLPEAMLNDAHGVVQALSRMYTQAAGGANLALRSAAWNDAKVDEHFAIVPTGQLPREANEHERAVFEAVAKRYLCQFYPAYEFLSHRLAVSFGSDEFRASRQESVKLGWKEVEGNLEQGGPRARGAADQDQQADGHADEQEPGRSER